MPIGIHCIRSYANSRGLSRVQRQGNGTRPRGICHQSSMTHLSLLSSDEVVKRAIRSCTIFAMRFQNGDVAPIAADLLTSPVQRRFKTRVGEVEVRPLVPKILCG